MTVDNRNAPPDNDLAAAVEMFFREPHPNPAEGWVSTLFLCRNELQDCLIGQIVPESQLLSHEHHRLFATAMVAFAGIELLAAFAPVPANPTRRRMFIDFVEEYSRGAGFPVTHREAAILWNFRNALSHTFGLFHLGDDGNVIPMYLYDQNSPAPVVRQRDGGWELCIDALVELFLLMVRTFRTKVESAPALQKPFLVAFSKYGRIYFRGAHLAQA